VTLGEGRLLVGLEAVAATAAADELRVHGVEVHSRVLPGRHVDVVEGEGTLVRLVRLGERLRVGSRATPSRFR
jgi:hypothetical protein